MSTNVIMQIKCYSDYGYRKKEGEKINCIKYWDIAYAIFSIMFGFKIYRHLENCWNASVLY